jgi:hypothetical protein
LLHHGDAVELRPDVGHATVLEAVEVHALDPDRLAGSGDPHELLLLRTGHDPPGGDGVAAGDNVLQVLLQVGEDRLEARDLLLEAGQRRLFVGRWIVVDQARVAALVDRRLSPARNACSKRVMISMLSDKASPSLSVGVDVATDRLLQYGNRSVASRAALARPSAPVLTLTELDHVRRPPRHDARSLLFGDLGRAGGPGDRAERPEQAARIFDVAAVTQFWEPYTLRRCRSEAMTQFPAPTG